MRVKNKFSGILRKPNAGSPQSKLFRSLRDPRTHCSSVWSVGAGSSSSDSSNANSSVTARRSGRRRHLIVNQPSWRPGHSPDMVISRLGISTICLVIALCRCVTVSARYHAESRMSPYPAPVAELLPAAYDTFSNLSAAF